MTNKTYITEKGKQILEAKIAEKAKHIKEIQEEKSIAYTASGDGWHDNPGYNQLIQLEERAILELKKLEKELNEATLWVSHAPNTESVQIGSIIQYRLTSKKNAISQEHIFEIVGKGESDLKNKQISYDSPIGSGLWAKKVGAKFELNLPAGSFEVEILMLYPNWESVAKQMKSFVLY